MKHSRLINFNRENVTRFLQDLNKGGSVSGEEAKNKSKEVANKLENFKR